jgi:hypothetical protein
MSERGSVEIGIQRRRGRFRAVCKPTGFPGQPKKNADIYGPWHTDAAEAEKDCIRMEVVCRTRLGMEEVSA